MRSGPVDTPITPLQQPLEPGDEARPGTPGTGEDTCRDCEGTGLRDGKPCPTCDGTGKIIQGIG